MSRTAIVIALVAAFLLGASLGLTSGILLTIFHHRPSDVTWFGRAPGMRERGEFGRSDRRVLRGVMVLPRLSAALDLTDEQEKRIRPLLEEAHRSMGAARDSLRVRIERELTPEQRERWRRLEARRGFGRGLHVPGDWRLRGSSKDEGGPR